MARNGLAGSKKGTSDTAKFYHNNPESRAKKIKYDKEYQKSPERVSYRVKLNKANRDAGTAGNGDGKDMSHTKSGKLVLESQSKNRARNGSGNKSTLK